MSYTIIKELLGEIPETVKKGDYCGEDAVIFTLPNGKRYALAHRQDCCENVRIEDIAGDLSDLEGAALVMAEESTNLDDPPATDGYEPESYTWTYYRFATVKGYVTIRFFGQSNGYYGERAEITEMEEWES